jgi:hypothetical protein
MGREGKMAARMGGERGRGGRGGGCDVRFGRRPAIENEDEELCLLNRVPVVALCKREGERMREGGEGWNKKKEEGEERERNSCHQMKKENQKETVITF